MRRIIAATATIFAALALGGCAQEATTIPEGVPVSLGTEMPLADKPVSSAQAREVFAVNSFEALVTKSDIVIIGRAISISPGRTSGEDVGGQLQFRDAAIAVETVLKGRYDAPTLTLEELGWNDGVPTTINDAAWAVPGDLMLMGLKATDNGRTSAGPRFILTSTASRFFLDDDGDVRDNYLSQQQASKFVSEAATLTKQQLLDQVTSAVVGG